MLIDTHAHLTDERFSADEVIANMRSDGLEKIITVSYDEQSSRRCLEIAANNENVYCAVGIHPDDCQRLEADPRGALLEMSKHEKCVAIGEIGLDYFYPGTQKDKQIYWLERQLELVEEAALPVIFHIRDAYEDMDKVLDRAGDKIKNGAVVHCFSGSKETAVRYVERGFYISFTGSITFKNAKKFYDIIPAVPLDRILIETDCPYLTPHPHRGEVNTPKMVRYQAEKIAEILDMPTAEVEKITTENAYRFFSKMKRG